MKKQCLEQHRPNWEKWLEKTMPKKVALKNIYINEYVFKSGGNTDGNQ